ncbi:unnamed protein product [Clonostachys rosea f. rosea IK726]|uniref:Methyltransferase domain-containing protein n=2 Tax=Bionectria ochroleuca TaxID=29856 RepID=A0A0B7KL35_BIOOC|nr:unnamed protein product [Clonostachys rosea f. rosea IK726]
MSVATEVGDDDHDSDPGYGGDEGSASSSSIASYLFRYEEKYGRTYQNYNRESYIYPNDEKEQERLDLVHHAYTLALRGLCLAPIESDKRSLRVLDIGTGTGIWAIDFGDKYPGASVRGVDLSPIQPKFVPPNVRFYVDDIEQDWIDSSYDYIHCRNIAGSIADWPALVGRIYSHLKPGGWAELQETRNTPYSDDDSLKAGNALFELMDNLEMAHAKIGRILDPAPSFKIWLERAGFHQVQIKNFKLPVGIWPKNERQKLIGACMAKNFDDGVHAFTAKPFRDTLGWPAEKVEVLNMLVRNAARNKSVHAIFDFVVVTAQKPYTTTHS